MFQISCCSWGVAGCGLQVVKDVFAPEVGDALAEKADPMRIKALSRMVKVVRI